MGVRLRLARFGTRKFPFYRIYAADARSPRDGKHLEILGHFNPIPTKDGTKHVGLHVDRVKYWLAAGAQPSRAVARVLSAAGIIPPMPQKLSGNQGKTKKDIKEAEA